MMAINLTSSSLATASHELSCEPRLPWIVELTVLNQRYYLVVFWDSRINI